MPWPLKRVWQQGVDWFVPPRCLMCHEVLEGPKGLCAPCWTSVQFISDPCCIKCGVPFEYEVNLTCLECLETPPLFKKARAPLVYQGPQRDLILRFKHADATHMAPLFGQWMMQAGKDFLKDCQALIPIPLHWTRLVRRRFNQAALLAQVVSHLSHIPHWPDLLTRTRRTPFQGQRNRLERQANVKEAFAISENDRKKIATLTVCLVDDVLTSGATVNECIRVLKEAGAKEVFVLTLARVPLT